MSETRSLSLRDYAEHWDNCDVWQWESGFDGVTLLEAYDAQRA